LVAEVCYLVVRSKFGNLPSVVTYVPYAIALLGGVITGRLSNREKTLTNSVIVGIIMSLSIGMLNYVQSYMGVAVDFGGIEGSTLAALLVMPFIVVVAVIGGALSDISRP